MRTRKILTWILAPLLGVVLLALAALVYLAADIDRFRPLINEQVSRTLGREFAIRGDIGLKISLDPAIRLNDVTLGNTPWGARPDMARIGYLEARISLPALMGGYLEFTLVHIREADVLLERSATGIGNWVLGTTEAVDEKSASDRWSAMLRHADRIKLTMHDSVYRFIDYQTGLDHTLRIFSETAVSRGRDQPLAINVNGDWDGHPVQMEGEVGRLLKWIGETGAPYPVRLHIKALDSDITIDGRINDPANMDGMDLKLTASTDRLSRLLDRRPGWPAKDDAFSLSATLTGNPQQYQVQGLDVRLAGGRITGDLSVIRQEQRPAVKGSLRLSNLDFSAWQADTPDAGTQKHGIAHDPLPLDLLRLFDIQIAVEGENLDLADVQFETLAANLDLHDGLLALSPARVTTAGDEVSTSLTVDAASDPATFGLKLEAPRLELQKWVRTPEGQPTAAGTLSAKLDLQGQGRTLAAILDSGTGSGQLVYREGNDRVDLKLERPATVKAGGSEMINVQADGRWRGHDIRLSGRVGRLIDLRSGRKPFPIDVGGEVLGIRGTVKGTVEDPFAASGMNLDVSAQAQSLVGLRPWMGTDFRDPGPVTLSTHLAGSPASLVLSKARLEILGASVNGDGKAGYPLEKAALDLDLEASATSLAKLLAWLESDIRDPGPVNIKTHLTGDLDNMLLKDVRIDALGVVMTAGGGAGYSPDSVRLELDVQARTMSLARMLSWLDLDLRDPGAVNLSSHLSGTSGKLQLTDGILYALGINGHIQGTVDTRLTKPRLDLDLNADAKSLAILRAWLNEGMGDPGPGRLSLHLTARPPVYDIHNVRAVIAGGRINATVGVSLAGPRPFIDANVIATEVDVRKLLPSEDGSTRTASTRKGKLFPDEPLPFEYLSQFNANLDLRLNNVTLPRYVVNESHSTSTLKNGHLNIALKRHQTSTHSASGSIDIDATADVGDHPPRVHLDMTGTDIDIGPILADTDLTGYLQGRVNVDVDVRGEGHSIAQIMASLSGHTLLAMHDGTVKGTTFDTTIGGVTAVLGTLISRHDNTTTIYCAIADNKAEGGIVTPLVIIDAEHSTIVIDGKVDLRTERLKLKVTPAAKGITLSVNVPVEVKGTLENPVYHLDKTSGAFKIGMLIGSYFFPPVLLVDIANLGGGKVGQCIDLASKSSHRKPAKGIQGIGSSIFDFVKDAGSAIIPGSQ
jgi:uncharacterized protein involved in outer membrane biogenesis